MLGMSAIGANLKNKTGVSNISSGLKTLFTNHSLMKIDTSRIKENKRIEKELAYLKTPEGKKRYIETAHENRKNGGGHQETYGERVANLTKKL
jgi:hypothetical protein